MRKLKARRWEWLQRTDYALFALVIAHAIYYGALMRVASPSTVLLAVSVIAVVSAQLVGVWLWRRKDAQPRDRFGWRSASRFPSGSSAVARTPQV